MGNQNPYRVKSISEFHKLCGLPKPEHPLISVINRADVAHSEDISLVLDYYSISIKKDLNGKIKYGQQSYDFNEGVMFFIAPNQVFGKVETNSKSVLKRSGWTLLVHPDFLWNTPLVKRIKQYEFFNYSVNEALFLSEKEEATINNIVLNIRQEYHANIDKFSKSIIISHIEALLNYADRFYHRQFLTREKGNHQILERLEQLLTDYFNSDDLISKGLPTVNYLAQALHLSPKYLGTLLKILTGQNAQQHIHEKLIEKAKEKLSTTNLSISEIAYQLGFEHLPSFSKLFKIKTKQTPLEFRASFN